jgi:hypothetical protein
MRFDTLPSWRRLASACGSLVVVSVGVVLVTNLLSISDSSLLLGASIAVIYTIFEKARQ